MADLNNCAKTKSTSIFTGLFFTWEFHAKGRSSYFNNPRTNAIRGLTHVYCMNRFLLKLTCIWSIKKSLKIPKGNQNLYIKKEQTTQWPKEKRQQDKQRSTKHTHKNKDRVTRTQLKYVFLNCLLLCVPPLCDKSTWSIGQLSRVATKHIPGRQKNTIDIINIWYKTRQYEL